MPRRKLALPRPKPEPKPKPKPKPEAEAEAGMVVSALTEAQVRAIVREEMSKWRHDATHNSTQAQVTAQWERDKAAGIALQ